jgi:hypothetical protein
MYYVQKMRKKIVVKNRIRIKARKGCPKRRTLRHTRGKRIRQQAPGSNAKRFIITAELGVESLPNWDNNIKPVLSSSHFASRIGKYLTKLTGHPKVAVSTTPVFSADANEISVIVDYETADVDIPMKRLEDVALDAFNYIQGKKDMTEYFYPARFDDDQDDAIFQRNDITVSVPKIVTALPQRDRKGDIPVEYFIDAKTNLKMARVLRGTILYRGERGGHPNEEQLMNRKYGTFLAGSKEEAMPYASKQLDVFEVVNDIHLLVFSSENMHRLIKLFPNTTLAEYVRTFTSVDSTSVRCSPLVYKPSNDMIYCPSDLSGEYQAMNLGIAINKAGFNGWYVPNESVSKIYSRLTRISHNVVYHPEEILLFNLSMFLRVREIIKTG